MDPPYHQYLNPKGYQRQRSLGSARDGGRSSGGRCSSPPMPQDNKKKKLIHRDIERQRRQEMSTLFASLRSHLPLQYIKGKRAVSDHVNGAVSFIKDMETNIKELSVRRDELSSNETGHQRYPSRTGSELNNLDPASSVTVQPCVNGFQVMVSSNSYGQESLLLSRVVETLQDQGLKVISSLTTKVNDRLMHIIQVEVNSFGCIDLAWLQQKLIKELIL
ncbi:unnamed protein product [Cochlearia groenlandica]